MFQPLCLRPFPAGLTGPTESHAPRGDFVAEVIAQYSINLDSSTLFAQTCRSVFLLATKRFICSHLKTTRPAMTFQIPQQTGRCKAREEPLQPKPCRLHK